MKIKLMIKEKILYLKKEVLKKIIRREIKKHIRKYKIDNLTNSQKKQVKEFWSKYIKNIDYNWYSQLTYDNKKFDSRYIPKDFFYCEIMPRCNDYSLVKSWEDKNYYDKLYFNFNRPKVLIRNIKNTFYNEKYEILSKENLEKLILNENNIGKDYVIKHSVDTCGGKSVEKIKITLDGVLYKNQYISCKELLEKYEENFLIQEIVKQSEFFNKINPNSLNTIRVMTYRDGEEFYLLSTTLRVGIGKGIVDNFSSGGFAIGINKNTGKLNQYGINGKSEFIFEKHPDTGEIFANKLIPNWEKIIKTIEEWSKEIPAYFKIGAWDIGIGEGDEPIFIEINLKYPDAEICQLVEPLFGEKTEYLLNKILK